MGIAFILVLLYLAIIALFIATGWKIFTKAGQPGWACLVPFYNSYLWITAVAGRPALWFWLSLIPLVNCVVALILMFMLPFDIAKRFGKDAGFGVGLLLLGWIFYPVLAFGDSKFQG